jgi:hypothetical protein
LYSHVLYLVLLFFGRWMWLALLLHPTSLIDGCWIWCFVILF